MRRRLLLAGGLAAPWVGGPAWGQSAARVVVVGGGFAGSTAARGLAGAGHRVTLLEGEGSYVACPFSNHVLVGLRELDAQSFGWEKVVAAGVTLVPARATVVDTSARRVSAGGQTFAYDRLVLAPGVELLLDALPGYGQGATVRMPHAWKAGIQTIVLREQVRAMADGGVVVVSVPPGPFRSPTGPYERASLIAWYLKTNKPRSKVLVLDANEGFALQPLFQQAWARLYPGVLEWVPGSKGGRVTGVDAGAMTFLAGGGVHRADVANVIPPQRAGDIALAAGVADRTGWCPIDPVTYESRLVPGIHVLGDAAMADPMPKSAFAAAMQARGCVEAMTALLAGRKPREPRPLAAVYSVVAPGDAFSEVVMYRLSGGRLVTGGDGGGTSALDAPAEVRAREAGYAEDWYRVITGSVFG